LILIFSNIFSLAGRALSAGVCLNLIRARALILMGAVLGTTSLAVPSAAASADALVRIQTVRDGNMTRFIVENLELCEITMTFEMDLVNMQGNVAFPHTGTFGPGKTEAFVLEPIDPRVKWKFSYTNLYKLGSHVAVHDDSVVYLLPYAAGRSYRVTQGYNGSFSHKGSNQYAIDWKMPEGTPIHASRGGVVVKIKDDSSLGGPSIDYDRHNNYVLIRHDDGTLAHYCHLKQHGVSVSPGQRVNAGERIALSGNTGFSSGPHLHFSIFKNRTGRERESIPVRFQPANSMPVTLVSGRSYRAAAVQIARADEAEPAERIPLGQ
jgi:hypothetical protein